MKVFKFGGASLKNAAAIKNVASIIKAHSNDQLLVVVSAMGKTTDALEIIIAHSHAGQNFDSELARIKEYHLQIIHDLFNEPRKVIDSVNAQFDELSKRTTFKSEYDFAYDQVIAFGEIISSVILHQYLLQEGLPSEWIDSRKFIRTDSTFREGQ